MQKQESIVIYTSEDGQTRVDVRMENETVWLTTSQMAILFEREESNIRRHVINVFKEGELEKENNVHFLHVNGVKKPVPFYNLDVIISVGYRVKSQRGVQFRKWANSILKEYLIKGYVINNDIKVERYNELKDVVRLMSRALSLQERLPRPNIPDFSMSLPIMYMRWIRLTVMTTRRWPSSLPPSRKCSVPPTRMPWQPSVLSRTSSAEASGSPTKRMIPSVVASDRFTRHSPVKTSTLPLKRKPPCSSTSWLRTTPSVMATSA